MGGGGGGLGGGEKGKSSGGVGGGIRKVKGVCVCVCVGGGVRKVKVMCVGVGGGGDQKGKRSVCNWGGGGVLLRLYLDSVPVVVCLAAVPPDCEPPPSAWILVSCLSSLLSLVNGIIIY